MSQVIHGNGVHHIHSHSNDQNWTYVLSISLSLSPGVSQTTLLPSVLGTSGSEVHVFVSALYFLNKSWGPIQLGFDIVSHSNKHREATNTHFIFQFFLNLYRLPKGRYTIIFQNASATISACRRHDITGTARFKCPSDCGFRGWICRCAS